jgi:hypothetical protein
MKTTPLMTERIVTGVKRVKYLRQLPTPNRIPTTTHERHMNTGSGCSQ